VLHPSAIGARCTFGAVLGVVCHLQADLSDRSSITPLRRVQSCFPTYLRVLLIQSLDSQTLPLSFLPLSPFLKCQPNLLKSSSPSTPFVTHWLRPVIVTLHPHSSTLMDFLSEGIVIGGDSVWEESGLARDRRMPFLQCLEQC
jgi:hypothetical protein